VPEPFASSDSSDAAMEADDGHLEESDLFDLYEAMHVPVPETRFSDNSGDEPIAEPAPPNHVDTPVSQPFRRWMSTLHVVTLSVGRGGIRRSLVYRLISKMVIRMGRYRQITCTSPYVDVRVNDLLHWDEDCLYHCQQHKHRSTLRCWLSGQRSDR
jgi:hypothetical protein